MILPIIYCYQKLEWASLSIDLLPHPDMFIDADMMGSKNGVKRDGDGAKRVFFGGERFLEGISGQAHVLHFLFLLTTFQYFFRNIVTCFDW